MYDHHRRPRVPKSIPSGESAERPNRRTRFAPASRPLIFNEDLSTTEVVLLLAIGLHDWGDGRGCWPSNATLARACRFKADGPDGGQKAVRKLLNRFKRDGYIRTEKVKVSRENPTGRLIFLTEKAGEAGPDPGPVGPAGDVHPRVYKPGTPGPTDPVTPGIQARGIDPGEQTHGTDSMMSAGTAARSSSSPHNQKGGDRLEGSQPATPPPSDADLAEVVAAAEAVFPGEGVGTRARQLCREYGKAIALGSLEAAKRKAREPGAVVEWSYVTGAARRIRREGGAIGRARKTEANPVKYHTADPDRPRPTIHDRREAESVARKAALAELFPAEEQPAKLTAADRREAEAAEQRALAAKLFSGSSTPG